MGGWVGRVDWMRKVREEDWFDLVLFYTKRCGGGDGRKEEAGGRNDKQANRKVRQGKSESQ